MPPIPVIAPTIVRVSLHHNLLNGRHADCVLDVSLDEVSGAFSRSERVAECAKAVGTAWQESMCSVINAPLVYTGGSYVDLDSLDSQSGSFGFTAGKPVNSGTAREIPPPNVAILITKNCAHSRSQRTGRMYVPGVREDFVSTVGEIGGSYQTEWQNAANSLLSKINALGGVLTDASTALRVVHVTGHEASSEPGRPPRPNAWSSSDVTSMTVQSRVATQRRRNRG